MSSVVHLVSWISLISIIINVYSDTHDCTEDGECKGGDVKCQSGEECTINCNGNSACYHTKVSCPSSQSCTVNCVSGNNVCHISYILISKIP